LESVDISSFSTIKVKDMDFLGPRGIVRGGQMPLPNQRQ